jgi:uncharacterized damage-inducible protein DinB
MHVGDLQRLYDYHYWATSQLMAVVSKLTPGQFVETAAGSYGSVRNTLVHVLSAEWGWLDRCGGPKRGEKLKAEDYPTVESVAVVWNRVEAQMRAFLFGLTDEDLAREIAFTLGGGQIRSVPLGDLLQHAAVHAVHHRGQVALLLRTLGQVPGNFDWLIYVESQRGQPA